MPRDVEAQDPPASGPFVPRVRRWAYRLAGAIVLLLAAAAWAVVMFDRSYGETWSGSTAVDVEFVVTDAGSGAPVAGAEVAVEGQDDGRPDERAFVLATDADGRAHRTCPHLPTRGRRSRLGITADANDVTPVAWVVRVTAPGYRPAGPFRLTDGGRWRPVRQQVRPLEPRADKLTVPVKLSRA